MIELPDGYDHPLRSGATGSDPESASGSGDCSWDDATEITRGAALAYRQIQDEAQPREPRCRQRKEEER